MKKYFFYLILFASLKGQAGLLMTYNQLALKDLDQMTDLARGKIKEAKKSTDGKIVPLKEGLQAVFSRPNDDGLISKVYPLLRSELERIDGLEKAFTDLTKEAIDALKNTKNFTPKAQVTYFLFLENLILEFKPLIKGNDYEKALVEKIAAADIELTSEAVKERQIRVMKKSVSPSELAKTVLNEVKAEEEAAAKAAKEKPAEPEAEKSSEDKN